MEFIVLRLLFGFALLALFLWIATVFIGESESGLVVRRFGRSLAQGRLIATDGEAGFQAAMLPPGWHFGVWRFLYKVTKVQLMVVPAGEIGLVVAADGASISSGRILGKEVRCDDFQDAQKFLELGGERGRQIAVLTAGTYRIHPVLFQVITSVNATHNGINPCALKVFEVPSDHVGIVTTLDGAKTPNGEIAGPAILGHCGFQDAAAFVERGGTRGLQEETLLAGSWTLNPWFAHVEVVQMTEVPIGHVGVVVSFVGHDHEDVSGDDFTHGDLVLKGRKGVWVEPLLPGKHAINTRVMRVELVPTTNIVLNWATQTEAHRYDERLSPITVRSKDGFAFSLDVSQIIHIAMKNAPRVISRVGSMQNLVDHVLQPTVANYFRNSAQEVSVLDFLSHRTQRQAEAFRDINNAVIAYDIECIDTLIGDIVPPGELMKTQTDRKIAEELKMTFEVQRIAQIKKQELERETAITQMQIEVVRSEQEVRIAERRAAQVTESAKGEASAIRARADAEADATRARASAEAEQLRVMGEARAEAYRQGVTALGSSQYTALQIAETMATHQMKLVPDIQVNSSDTKSGLIDLMLTRMNQGS